MVLTEAFAAGTPVVASDIAGYRDVVARRRRRPARPARRRHARWPRRCATSRSTRARTARARRRGAARSAERYAWPRVAEQVVERLRGRARRARSPRAPPARAAVRIGAAPGRPGAAPARAAPAVARAGAAPRGAPARCCAAARSALRGARRRRRRRLPRARSASALRPDRRTRSCARSPAWVLVGPGADVRLDGRCAPSPGTRSCAAALPDARPRFADAMQGTTIGVLMSATLPARLGEPSRALIVARRLGRPRERAAGRARHARLPDAAQRARAGDPRRGDVHHRRAVRRPPAGAALVRAGAGRRAAARCSSRRRCCAPACRRARRACTAGCAQARGALARVRRGLVVFRRPRLGRRRDRRCSSAPGRCSGCRCYVLLVALGLDHKRRPRRRGRGAVRGQRHRRAAGHAVEPRRLPGRVRGGAHRRLRRRRRRRRSATGSSCRPSRSPPRSSWARPRWSRRACPGARCACARCTRAPVSLSPLPRRGAQAARRSSTPDLLDGQQVDRRRPASRWARSPAASPRAVGGSGGITSSRRPPTFIRDALVPARDDLAGAEREAERLAAVPGGVELLAVS